MRRSLARDALLILLLMTLQLLVILLNMMELRLSCETVAAPKVIVGITTENPHQRAALYVDLNIPVPPLSLLVNCIGKELSYNNILDLTGLSMVCSFTTRRVALKHNNPCGAAVADTIGEAVRKGMEGDPLAHMVLSWALIVRLTMTVADYLVQPGRLSSHHCSFVFAKGS